MSRYIIIGAGAIGASLAAQFELRGIPYLLFGRGEQIRHIQAAGLECVRPEGTRNLRLKACAAIDELTLGQDDVLVMTTKTQDLEAACQAWAWQPVQGPGRARCAAELPVLTLQNGMAAERIALRWFDQVYGASINTPARFTQVGQVVVGGYPEVGLAVVGRYPQGEGALAAAIAADLCRAGYLAEAQPDILRWKAAKLISSVRNGLEVFDGPAARVHAFHRQLVQEVLAVLAAMGIEPASSAERQHAVGHWGIAPGSGIEPGQQSTWQSIARGVSNEVDYLNGEVALLGRLQGVPTPFNAALQRAIGQLTRSSRPSADGCLGHIDELWAAVEVGRG